MKPRTAPIAALQCPIDLGGMYRIAELFIFDVHQNDGDFRCWSSSWRSFWTIHGCTCQHRCLDSIQAAQKTGLWPIAQNLPVG
jgi:hypothetical protein